MTPLPAGLPTPPTCRSRFGRYFLRELASLLDVAYGRDPDTEGRGYYLVSGAVPADWAEDFQRKSEWIAGFEDEPGVTEREKSEALLLAEYAQALSLRVAADTVSPYAAALEAAG